MSGRLKQFFSQRGMRKLRQDKMAMGALFVIGCYLILALFVVAHLPSPEAVVMRVGPDNIPGVFGTQTAEKRLSDAEFRLEALQRAVRTNDPETSLAEFRMGDLRILAGTPKAVESRIEGGWKAFEAVAVYDDIEAEAVALELLENLESEVAALFSPPTGFTALASFLRLSLGTDRQGRSIALRAIYSTKVAVQIGMVAALISVLIGTLLGAAAGYFGGWVDHLVVWLYSIFSSIPWIVMLMVLASMFRGSRFDGGLIPVYAAFCMSFWISPCRVIRGEVMKLKELEYVQAASAIGFGHLRILLRHVIPNTAHLMFINFSLLFIGAIKAEVILSFLGLGVKDEPSWGVMINHAKAEVLNGFFWQIGAATAFMLVLVLAFNILSDALQDAFDPKHV
ncbi:MAG TPA: ABC transporter permease [Planctomycetes bacterium]|jgi:peptide/nickel transport system permease protein|nr:ABC transporter permease [Planctomycetota bacterium]HIL53308.1 ABC transporter permease [Planctomycetota bacterium]